jgi:hypothetical protein
VYTFPMVAAPQDRAVVVTTGGLEGLPMLYAYDLVTGTALASVALPGSGGTSGTSYPTAPVCADVTGEGRITHCYALREDGLLVRVPVNVGSFGAPVDITPNNGGGTEIRGGGRRYYSSPAVYFGADGVVNLVFGSGDFRNLTSPGGQNYVYRVKDTGTRTNGVGAGRATVDGVCTGSGSASGIFPLPAGERLLASPIVDSGVVAWTSYRAETSGCVAGSSEVYAMDFESCVDAVDGAGRPDGRDAGLGLPSEPVLHRRSQTLMVQTSASPTAAQTDRTAVRTRGNGQPWTRLLYWRLELDNR